MKKTASIILLFFAGNFFSQENLFLKIKDQIKKEYPEIKMENKLILVNTWSVNDSKSREANVQVNKAITVYEGAKLKGGPWGIIAVLVCKDEDFSKASITLNKDKITKGLTFKNEGEFNFTEFTNIVYDVNGKEVYKNISPENIYESIHQLITR